MSYNDDAIQRLIAAQNLMQGEFAGDIAQAGTQTSITIEHVMAIINMIQEIRGHIAEAKSQNSIGIQFVTAGAGVIQEVDGYTQQAVGQSAITSYLSTLNNTVGDIEQRLHRTDSDFDTIVSSALEAFNTACEHVMDQLQGMESMYGDAATQSGVVVNEIQSRIQSLMAAGG